jgi:signal transduction histidine kinase/ligand-binding sensor domain-containing protein
MASFPPPYTCRVMGRARRTHLSLRWAALLAAPLILARPSWGARFSSLQVAGFGLPLRTITAILDGRDGFLWIGSRDGLVLYDGYEAILFEHDINDPASIGGNYIRAVYEDARGAIWIGTNASGLERLDRSDWTFRHLRHDPKDPASLPHNTVYAIVEDRDGRLWVGTQGGLARLDPDSGRFERFPAGENGPGSDFIVALRLDEDDALWVATGSGGLSRRDPTTGRFSTHHHDPADPGSLSGNGVYAFAEDRRGRLWLATNGGVCWLDRASGSFHTVPLERPADSGAPIVTSVVVDASGSVWATRLAGGLFELVENSGPALFVRRPFATARSADSSASIWITRADRLGNLWLGTSGEGLGRIPPRSRELARAPESGSSEGVASLLVDSDHRLWMGLLNGPIEILDEAGSSRRIDLGASPLPMIEDGSDVWIGTSRGLGRLRRGTDTPEWALHDEKDPRSLGDGWVLALCVDREGSFWVGTGGGGLNLRHEDGTFEHLVNVPDDPGSLSDDYVTAIAEADGLLWVGTRSGGLNALDRARRRFRRYGPDPRDEHSLGHHNVSTILADRSGNLWIGTAGGGVGRARRDSAGIVTGFDRFTERDGLISNNVVSLLEDDDGSIWVGTRKGLSRFDPASRRVVSYGASDGLVSAELTIGAAASGRDALYFGTSEGVVAVRRGTPFPALLPSPTAITAIRTLGSPEAWTRPAPVDTGVEIPWGRIVSFEFAVLDFGDRTRHAYAYRIDGKNRDWVDLASTREITFTDLDPGRYALRVRGRNDQGIWSETASPVRIVVVPPFWMTPWFRALVIALVAGLAFTGHHYRLSRLKKRNRELEELKNQREWALDRARASQEALHGAYERLRWLTRRLEAAKEDERKHIAREIHDEMGQALTTAKINLKLVSGSASGVERDRHIADAIGLIDKMIGHVRTLSLDLRPPLLDELGLAAALGGYIEALSKRAGRPIDLNIEEIPRDIPPEMEITAFRVVQESLTNVLRHAGAEHIEVEVGYHQQDLLLRVRDDGRGFDVRSVLERAAVGEHVGILGMRERVESMGGSLEIASSPGDGTTVQARIPMGS